MKLYLGGPMFVAAEVRDANLTVAASLLEAVLDEATFDFEAQAVAQAVTNAHDTGEADVHVDVTLTAKVVLDDRLSLREAGRLDGLVLHEVRTGAGADVKSADGLGLGGDRGRCQNRGGK